MPSFFQSKALAALLALSATLTAAQSGSGTTTRYWDCCKPSCAWSDKPGIASPVKTCDVHDKPLSDQNAQSGCAGGSAYMCSDQSPWAVSDDLAYGFAAVNSASPACCACYQLTFTSGPIQGKKMIVQATNTGSDVGNTQFDLAMPGGGFGMFDGCSKEWGATSAVWGAQYGGPSTNTCSSFPQALQPGCGFRWGWMKGADNPSVNFEVVTCPAAIVAKSGCSVSGYKAPTSPQPVPVSSKKTTSTTATTKTTSSVSKKPTRKPTPAKAQVKQTSSIKKLLIATTPTTLAKLTTTSSSSSTTSVKAVPTQKPVWRKGHHHRAPEQQQKQKQVEPVAQEGEDDSCEA